MPPRTGFVTGPRTTGAIVPGYVSLAAVNPVARVTVEDQPREPDDNYRRRHFRAPLKLLKGGKQ